MKEPQKLEMRPIAFSGGCLCGSVRFSGTGLRDIVYCHCRQCRAFHGNAAAYTATVQRALTFSLDASLSWYDSSPGARRGFCANCGSSLFWKPAGKAYLCIAAGAIDDAGALRAARHVFVAEKADYYSIDDDLPQFEGSMHG